MPKSVRTGPNGNYALQQVSQVLQERHDRALNVMRQSISFSSECCISFWELWVKKGQPLTNTVCTSSETAFSGIESKDVQDSNLSEKPTSWMSHHNCTLEMGWVFTLTIHLSGKFSLILSTFLLAKIMYMTWPEIQDIETKCRTADNHQNFKMAAQRAHMRLTDYSELNNFSYAFKILT